jgi:hypothetical protein
MSYPSTLPNPQVGGPVGGIAPKASSLTFTPAYSAGHHRFYPGGPGTQFPGMLVAIGGLLEFILGNTFTFDAFSLNASRISKPTQPGLPTVLAKEEAIHEMV